MYDILATLVTIKGTSEYLNSTQHTCLKKNRLKVLFESVTMKPIDRICLHIWKWVAWFCVILNGQWGVRKSPLAENSRLVLFHFLWPKFWKSWGIFKNLNKMKTESLSNHMSRYFIHTRAGSFSTRTVLWWSHAVLIAAVCGFTLSCWNKQSLPWNRRHLEGSRWCSKTFIYCSAFIVPSKTFKLPILYAFLHPHTRDAGFWAERW